MLAHHSRLASLSRLRKPSNLLVKKPGRSPHTRAHSLRHTDWLQANLEEVSLIDVRPYDHYLEGHVPNSVHLCPSNLGFQADENEQLCTDPSTYIPLLEARGIDGIRPIVVYDGGDQFTAALVWWAFSVYGMRHNAHVLQGGYSAWLQNQGKEELYEPCPLKLSTQYEGADEPQLQHVARSVDADKHVVMVSSDLACSVRDTPPNDLHALQQAIEQATGVALPDIASSGECCVVFGAARDADLPFACYVAMMWNSFDQTANWAAGVVCD